ncbi:MAG: hypothetical protein CR997_12315 [Acidobacteria bacterium]|nr:MAG: hypothetical protein CR997_12315 [Acidobacteriota bacterium]
MKQKRSVGLDRKRGRRVIFKKAVHSMIDEDGAKLKNISKSGCLINARQWLKVDETCHEISINHQNLSPVTAVGKVVRAKMVQDEHGAMVYEIGIRFSEDDPHYQVYRNWFKALVEAVKPPEKNK